MSELATLTAGNLRHQDIARPIPGRGDWLVVIGVEEAPRDRVMIYYYVEGATYTNRMTVARDEVWEHRGYTWQGRVSELTVTPAHAPMPVGLLRPGLVLVSIWHGQLTVLGAATAGTLTTLITRYPRSGQPMMTEHGFLCPDLDVRVETDVRGDELAIGDLIIDQEVGAWVEVTSLPEPGNTAAADSYWDRAYVDPTWELEQARTT